MTEASELLKAAEAGDPQAASKLLPLVYDELRRLAGQRLAQEAPGQTLQPTALVHEAYLRLTGENPGKPWHNRGHFFAAAGEAMRRILIENARRKRRARHGGEKRRLPLDPAFLVEEGSEGLLLEINDALDRLALEEAEVAEVVKLRYFVGLTIEQAAEALGISVRTANRHWSYARAWLYQHMS